MPGSGVIPLPPDEYILLCDYCPGFQCKSKNPQKLYQNFSEIVFVCMHVHFWGQILRHHQIKGVQDPQSLEE